MMGTGCAKGQGRARLAAEMAIQSPLLDNISVEGATGVLINIVGGPDLKMKEIQEAASLVQEQAHEDANIIFGASIDETLGENVKVTVIATGFDAVDHAAAQERATFSSRSTLLPMTVQSMQAQQQQHHAQPAPVRSNAFAAPPPRSIPQAAPEQVAVATSRRYADPRAAAQPAPASVQRAPVRTERAPVSFPSMDNDWDVPAFQRKQQ